MVELVRSGRTPESLGREFEPSAESIRNWVRQADLDEGRRDDGLGSLALVHRSDDPNARYTREDADMAALFREDGGGYAHPGWALGLANAILASNVRLGPWIHVQSEVAHLAAIPRGASLRVEGSVVDLFRRGRHEFVDLDVTVFLSDDTPALFTRHRAIYLLGRRDAPSGG